MNRSYTLALDAGGTTFKSALFEGERICPDSLTTEPVDSSGTADEIRAAYRATLGRQVEWATAHEGRVCAVSVDTPGPFDYDAGFSRMTHKYQAIRGVPLKPWIQEATGHVPIRFLHDAHAFLLGVAPEFPDLGNIAGVMIGTGLGFAVQVDGRVLLNPEGGPRYSLFQQPCRGKTAEDFVSARGLVDAYHSASASKAGTAKDVAERARAGDEMARHAYRELGEILAEVTAPVLAELGIEALILGGQVSYSFGLFSDSLEHGLSGIPSLRRVFPTKHIDTAHLLGAARYVR